MEKKILIGIASAFLTLLLISSCIRDVIPRVPPNPNDHKNDSVSLVLTSLMNPDSIKANIEWLQSMGTRFAFAHNRRSVATRIRDRLRRIGYTDAYLDSFYISMTWRTQSYALWQYNIIAELRFSTSNDSIMILGAHYDDVLSTGDPAFIAPGANDNASGVAAMLEVARVMKSASFTPSHSIRFIAFGAEEEGLLGSMAYASRLAYSGITVMAMVNNDMIAFENNASSLNWYLKVMHYHNAEDLANLAISTCGKYSGLTGILDTIYNRDSDSYSFYLHDIPSVYFASASYDNDYHTLNDVSSNCNFKFCTEVAAISCALLVYSDQKQY